MTKARNHPKVETPVRVRISLSKIVLFLRNSNLSHLPKRTIGERIQKCFSIMLSLPDVAILKLFPKMFTKIFQTYYVAISLNKFK